MKLYFIIGLACVLLTTYLPGFEEDMNKWARKIRHNYSSFGFFCLWAIATFFIVLLWPMMVFALLQGIWSGIKKR